MAGGFENLEGAVDLNEAMQPITADEVATADDQWSDDVALGIVLEDVSGALDFLQSKGLVPLGIENADDLVRGYQKPKQWADGKPRANLPMHVVLQAIEKILPVLFMSLFSGKQPFILDAKGKTKPEAADANAKVLNWAIGQAGFKEEIRRSLKTTLTYGFFVGSYGWESRNHRQKVYKRNDAGNVVGSFKDIPINVPTFECLDLKNVIVDPGCKIQDVRKGAKFIAKQTMVTAYDLDQFRDDDTYHNIPSNAELAEILAARQEITEDSMLASKGARWREFQAELDSKKTSKDPLQQPLEILEYWTNDRVVTVMQRKIVIRNEENEFGKLPFVSCCFIDVLGSAWGFGIAKLLAGEQRFQSGVVNNWIDALALVLNPVYQMMKGIGVGTQSIPVSPGKVITESGELKPLITPDITQPAMTAIESSDQRASRKVGADGGTGMPDQAMRTAQGVQAFAGDVIQRLQYFLEIFIDLVYVPVLEAFIQMSKDHLTPEQINTILNDEDGKAYEGDILEVYNAYCGLDVVAGTKLTQRYAAAQIAPLILQLVAAGPVQDSFNVQGKKFDYEKFIHDTLPMMGWADADNYIIDSTPADQARAAAQNPAIVKAQSDAAKLQQTHDNTLTEIDAKGSQQAGVAVVRSILKNHEQGSADSLSALQDPTGQTSGQ